MSHPRVNILGVAISAIDLRWATHQIEGWVAENERHYVNICTVHTIMECRRAPRLRAIVNGAAMATPDGMPLVWLSRLHGHRETGRVYGPDLMLSLCGRSGRSGLRHFFYGGGPDVAPRLVSRLKERFPDLKVAGHHTPPFRPADTPEAPEVIERINLSGADVVWVGLGTPKQDYWIARHRPLLEAPVLIAVGAAFDFHAGLLAQAPGWMQRSGLEWLFRLAHEPRRLAMRYLRYNPLFIYEVLLQLSGLRDYPLSVPAESAGRPLSERQ